MTDEKVLDLYCQFEASQPLELSKHADAPHDQDYQTVLKVSRLSAFLEHLKIDYSWQLVAR